MIMNNENNIFELRSCVWEITLKCCFSCKYCGSKAGKSRKNELTTNQCLDIANQLAELGCQRVTLIGGEVFTRDDWYIIVKALSDRNINVAIVSNGFLFSEKILSELKMVNVESVAISLDGPEKTHDKFRCEGSFSRAIDAIDRLTDNNIPVSVISTLHSFNVSQLEEMYRILKDKNIFAWQLQACSPMGNACEQDFSVDIDFNEVISFVEKYKDNANFIIGIADNIGYYTKSEGYLRGNLCGNGYFVGCSAGLTNIGIDSIGNVRGCESMYDDSFIEGNLKEQSLYEIWNNPEAFSYNRHFTHDKLTGKCAECEYGERCAGGCRSYNYFSHGKIYESTGCVQNNK